MRIEGPRGASDIKKSEKARKSGGASSSFGTFLESEAEEATGTRGAAPMVGIGNLLTIQGAEDPAERKARKRMTDRAGRVLDTLETVHKGLLAGSLTTQHLDDVTKAIAERREKIADAQLLGLLDEVDLRAQVELAKLEMARDRANKNK